MTARHERDPNATRPSTSPGTTTRDSRAPALVSRALTIPTTTELSSRLHTEIVGVTIRWLHLATPSTMTSLVRPSPAEPGLNVNQVGADLDHSTSVTRTRIAYEEGEAVAIVCLDQLVRSHARIVLHS